MRSDLASKVALDALSPPDGDTLYFIGRSLHHLTGLVQALGGHVIQVAACLSSGTACLVSLAACQGYRRKPGYFQYAGEQILREVQKLGYKETQREGERYLFIYGPGSPVAVKVFRLG